jgi:hypothetical protein
LVIAMIASRAMTAVYHAGHSDFRSDKLRKRVTGDLIIGAPIAHGHVGAVAHDPLPAAAPSGNPKTAAHFHDARSAGAHSTPR